MNSLNLLFGHLARIFRDTFTAKAFLSDNGYKHVIIFLALFYTFFYGFGTPTPDGSIWEAFLQYVIIALLAFGIAYFGERIEVKISDGTQVSATDILWSIIAACVALAIYNQFGRNEFLLWFMDLIAVGVIILTFKNR